MALSSLRYLLFLGVTAGVYYCLPPRFRSPLLLAASLCFYALLQPFYCLLLLAAAAVSWLCAAACKRRLWGRGRLWIALGAAWLFGMLFLYKYLDFFARSVQLLLGRPADFAGGLLLPVGISFYTFTAAAYLFDVGGGRLEPEKAFWRYLLFLSFFPALLSGPINRGGALLPQLREPRGFSYPRFKRGLLRLTLGAAKKLILADNLALLVNAAYGDLQQTPGFVMLAAVLCYPFQIYFDFAGYTDMALGSAEILGYSLPENFRAPFLAQTIKDFWRRWHISLTSWLRDYVYFPLGGSRVGRLRLYLNILTVFAVSGLWHGAGGTFLVWGLLNGLYQVIGMLLPPKKTAHPRLAAVCRTVRTCLLIAAAWVFFRAETCSDALAVWALILRHPLQGFGPGTLRLYIPLRRFLLALGGMALYAVFAVRRERTGVSALAGLEERALPYWLLIALTAFAVALFGCYGGFNPQSFVYFRF